MRSNSALTSKSMIELSSKNMRRSSVIKKKPEESIKARCDSFVVKTDVHFSTDTNLLWDALRKIIQISAQLCQAHDLTEWRQSRYHLRSIKKSYRLIQTLKHSTSKVQKLPDPANN